MSYFCIAAHQYYSAVTFDITLVNWGLDWRQFRVKELALSRGCPDLAVGLWLFLGE